MIDICYNQVVSFYEWINDKYIQWRGNRRSTVTEFAEYIGISQSLLSQYMTKNGKIPKSNDVIQKLFSRFGIEVYQVLGLPSPEFSPFEKLPPKVQQSLIDAWNSASERMKATGTTIDTPEGWSIFTEEVSKAQDRLNAGR